MNPVLASLFALAPALVATSAVAYDLERKMMEERRQANEEWNRNFERQRQQEQQRKQAQQAQSLEYKTMNKKHEVRSVESAIVQDVSIMQRYYDQILEKGLTPSSSYVEDYKRWSGQTAASCNAQVQQAYRDRAGDPRALQAAAEADYLQCLLPQLQAKAPEVKRQLDAVRREQEKVALKAAHEDRVAWQKREAEARARIEAEDAHLGRDYWKNMALAERAAGWAAVERGRRNLENMDLRTHAACEVVIRELARQLATQDQHLDKYLRTNIVDRTYKSIGTSYHNFTEPRLRGFPQCFA